MLTNFKLTISSFEKLSTMHLNIENISDIKKIRKKNKSFIMKYDNQNA